MTVERFLREREPEWKELQALLDGDGQLASRAAAGGQLASRAAAGRGKPERLGADGLRRLGALYRAAAADLAFARRTFPGDPLTQRLEALVIKARQAVYADEPRRISPLAFLTTGYFQRVRERPIALATAAALLLVPMILSAVWAIDDPAAAIGIVPEQFRAAADPGGGTSGLEPGQHAALSSEIFTNNIQVAFLAVAGGVLLGLGTIAVTIYNGGFIGALAGLTIEGGSSGDFFRLVVPHGVLELSCMVVEASAGLRLGWALVEPGTLTRGESLKREARPALEVVVGTIPWIVLAGLVEGFVTGELALGPAIALGVALGAIYVALIAYSRSPSARASGTARASAQTASASSAP